MPKIIRRGQVVQYFEEDSAPSKLNIKLPKNAANALSILKKKHPSKSLTAIVSAALVLAAKSESDLVSLATGDSEFQDEVLGRLQRIEDAVGAAPPEQKKAAAPPQTKPRAAAKPEPPQAEPPQSKAATDPKPAPVAPPPKPPEPEPEPEPKPAEPARGMPSQPLRDLSLLAEKRKTSTLTDEEEKIYKEEILLKMYSWNKQGLGPPEIAAKLNDEDLPLIAGSGQWTEPEVVTWMNQHVLPRQVELELKLEQRTDLI